MEEGETEGGFQGRVLQGTVRAAKWECRGGGKGGGFGRVGNHSLRVLYRLFLLLFHLSHWEHLAVMNSITY